MSIEAIKRWVEIFGGADWHDELVDSAWAEKANQAIKEMYQAIEQAQKQEPVTVLPDGSAFAVMSYPLSKEHWLYAEREYRDGEDEPVELGQPILTHQLRDAVVSAVRYAVRGATNCGKEVDFDPDALVQNAVYALCGPYGVVYTSPPQRQPLTDEQIEREWQFLHDEEGNQPDHHDFARAIEAAHGITGEQK